MNGQDLKNSILQYAIQGKLVEQREEEGTARELLEQIAAEKKQLIKEGKIKKQKALPDIKEDETPFDIPESWEWVRLETVTYCIGDKSNQIKQSEILQEGQYPVVSQSMNRIEGYSNEKNKILKVEPVSVIVFGDHSKTLKLIDFDFIIGADGTKIMVPIALSPDYLYYVLNYNVIYMRDRGYSRHFQFLKEKLIPLPPLEEQKRIVAKIEELKPYVDQYDKAYSEVEELDKKFPDDMQKSILQYAIQGKLVEQREEEGTARELYRQIQEEKKKLIKEGKIKKTKALPEITEDEIPFDIPKSWEWVRLIDLGLTQTGNTPSKTKMEYFGNFIPFISPGDILNGVINYANQGLSEQGKEVGRVSERNSILQVCIGGSIGKCAINSVDVSYNQQINAITPLVCNHLYVYYLMDSKFFLVSMTHKATGTATPIINKSSWESIVVPLPPLEEQKRIVAKIEELMPYTKATGEIVFFPTLFDHVLL